VGLSGLLHKPPAVLKAPIPSKKSQIFREKQIKGLSLYCPWVEWRWFIPARFWPAEWMSLPNDENQFDYFMMTKMALI
jgi:hypothetical protein